MGLGGKGYLETAVSKFIKQVLVLGFLDDGKYVPRAALFVT